MSWSQTQRTTRLRSGLVPRTPTPALTEHTDTLHNVKTADVKDGGKYRVAATTSESCENVCYVV